MTKIEVGDVIVRLSNTHESKKNKQSLIINRKNTQENQNSNYTITETFTFRLLLTKLVYCIALN